MNRRIIPMVAGTAGLACAVLLAACQTEAPKPLLTKINPLRGAAQPAAPAEAAASLTDAASAMRRAGQLLQEGNKDDALYYYVKALELDGGKNREALDRIGDIHAGKGNAAPAEAAYRLALELEPKDADALAGLGLLLLGGGKPDEAKRLLAAAVDSDPGRWRAHNGLGLLADRNGDHPLAAQHYERALQAGGAAMVWNNLGYSKYLAGDLPGALRCFDAALKLDGHYEPAWLNKGLVHTRLGEEQAALQAFRRVLEPADAYNNLGYLYMLEGKADPAYEYLQKAIAASPGYHELANENLGRLRATGK